MTPDPRLPIWLPNAITVVRIALIPCFVWVASRCTAAVGAWDMSRTTTFAVLAALALSDVLDGWLARRFGLATPFGALLDAVADKIAQVTLIAYFTFGASDSFAPVPLWFFVFLVARDLVLLSGSLLVRMRRGKVAFEHEVHGKLASFLMFALLIWITAGGAELIVTIAAWTIAAFVGISTIGYVQEGWRQWSQEPHA